MIIIVCKFYFRRWTKWKNQISQKLKMLKIYKFNLWEWYESEIFRNKRILRVFFLVEKIARLRQNEICNPLLDPARFRNFNHKKWFKSDRDILFWNFAFISLFIYTAEHDNHRYIVAVVSRRNDKPTAAINNWLQ